MIYAKEGLIKLEGNWVILGAELSEIITTFKKKKPEILETALETSEHIIKLMDEDGATLENDKPLSGCDDYKKLPKCFSCRWALYDSDGRSCQLHIRDHEGCHFWEDADK